MGSKIVVDTSAIEAARNRLEAYKSEFHACWSKVMALKNEIDASWDGADNTAFNSKVEGFRNDFTDLENKIEDYIQFLNKAKREYDNAQSSLEQLARNMLASDR